VSSWSRGPIVRASRTTIHPFGVFQVVSSTFVPGSYATEVGWLIPNGAKRKKPAWRSSRLPNTLGESNRGTQSQSIAPSGATRAPVWQFERKAYSAIGGKGEGAAALWGRGSVKLVVIGASFRVFSKIGNEPGPQSSKTDEWR